MNEKYNLQDNLASNNYNNESYFDYKIDHDTKKELKPYHTHEGTVIWLTKEQIKLRKLSRRKKKKKNYIYIYY